MAEEPARRFLGFAVGSAGGAPDPGRPFPAGQFGPADRRWLGAALHPVAAWRRWRKRRRLGPYDVDE